MTMQFKFTTSGFRALARNMRGSKTIINGRTNRMLRNIGTDLVPALKAETPRRSNRLANSTRFQIVGGINRQMLQIRQGARTESGSFYGHFVRGGTVPHEIVPVRATALRFTIGNRVIFAQKVMHPGTKANRYDERTLQQQSGNINTQIQRAGIDISVRLTRGVTGSRD